MTELLAAHRAELHAIPTKFIFFDVDGTLKNSQHRISDSTIRSVRRLASQGIGYGLASGRPYFGAQGVLRLLNVRGPSVFFSGALVIEPESGNVLHQEALSPAEVQLVLDFGRRAGIFMELYTPEDYFCEADSPLAEIHALYLDRAPRRASFADLIAREPILKVEFVADTPLAHQQLRQFAAETRSLHFGLGYGASHPHLVFGNVTSPKASREAALNKILTHLQLHTDNIAAFGDAEADIPFLRLAALGIAMGNAPIEVQRQARYVTKSVDEDGVAYALDIMLR